ncbi:MAG: PAS domain S-box protein [Elusimicrobia bacterium]|nr:PAS domain S-box protein [Elusimicrobiota bacterium]
MRYRGIFVWAPATKTSSPDPDAMQTDTRRLMAVRASLALAALAGLAVANWAIFQSHEHQTGLRGRAVALAGSQRVTLERASCLIEWRTGGEELGRAAERLSGGMARLASLARLSLAEPLGAAASLEAGAAEIAARVRALSRPGGATPRARGAALSAVEGLRGVTEALSAQLERESEAAVRRLRARALGLLAATLGLLAALATFVLRPLWRSLRREVARLSRMLEDTLESMADGVLVVNRLGQVLQMNPAARAMLGAGGAAQKRPWPGRFEACKADGTPLTADDVPVLQAINAGSVVERELRIRPPGRDWVWISTRASPLRGEGGIEGAVSVLRDITERKSMEEELKRKTEELSRSNAELETFASIASHELQEPMRKIVAFGDRLQTRSSAALPPESREDLERIQRAAQRMMRLIENLLRYAKVELKPAAFERIPLDEVLDDALLDVEARLEASGGRVERGALPAVWGDRSQLEQVFANLLSNALKFRKPDVAPQVRIAARDAGDFWEIRFSDNGIGFDPKYASRLFEPFARLHPRDRFEGSGLGLAIARRIARRHGGDLLAEARPADGAEFVLRMPKGGS